MWLESQLNYAKILNSVEPLTAEQNEGLELEGEAIELRNKSEALKDMVSDYEQKIEQYKPEGLDWRSTRTWSVKLSRFGLGLDLLSKCRLVMHK